LGYQNLIGQENMPAQNNANSPFQNNSEPVQNNPEDFSIHTMKTDLESLEKNGVPNLEKNIAPIEKEIFTKPVAAPIQQQKTFSPQSTQQHPFLEKTIAAAPLAPKVEIKKEAVAAEIAMPEKRMSMPSSNRNIILTLIVILTISIIGLSGYYFWLTRTSSTPAPVVLEPVVETPIQEPVNIVSPLEKYSAAKPNYLVINMENISAAEIKTVLSNAANDLRDSSAQSIYEFMVVDNNNNPITLPVFAAAAELTLSQKIITALGNDFTLFVYNDNGSIRLGFSTSIQNKEFLIKELQLQENTLSQDVAFMFLDSVPETTTGAFKDGFYNNYKTRYFNMNTQATFSIDYAVTDSKLIIGTSKNTLRAVIDKQLLAISPQEQKAENNDEAYVGNVANPALTETAAVQEAPLLSE